MVYNNKLPFIEKYRPHQPDEILGHQHIINTIDNYIRKQIYPHFLFYGPPGTGKTSTILVYANQLYGNHKSKMIMHLNASDERGIDIIRNRIKDFINTKSLFMLNKPKLVVLDEADAMTEDAQLALRELIINSKSTFFCLICNYINKINHTLQSRFIKYYFPPLEKDKILSQLEVISNQENIKYTKKGLIELYQLSQGDMRKCLNLLQSASSSNNIVDDNYIYQLFGKIKNNQIHILISTLLNNSYQDCLEQINTIMTQGISITNLIQYLGEYIMKYSFNETIVKEICLKLSNLEYNCSLNINQSLQISGLISVFIHYRHLL